MCIKNIEDGFTNYGDPPWWFNPAKACERELIAAGLDKKYIDIHEYNEGSYAVFGKFGVWRLNRRWDYWHCEAGDGLGLFVEEHFSVKKHNLQRKRPFVCQSERERDFGSGFAHTGLVNTLNINTHAGLKEFIRITTKEENVGTSEEWKTFIENEIRGTMERAEKIVVEPYEDVLRDKVFLEERIARLVQTNIEVSSLSGEKHVELEKIRGENAALLERVEEMEADVILRDNAFFTRNKKIRELTKENEALETKVESLNSLLSKSEVSRDFFIQQNNELNNKRVLLRSMASAMFEESNG